MRDRCRQIDMAHTFPTHTRQRDLHTALLTGNAAILDPLIFPAKALIIFDRAKDTRAEQAITLRLEGPVIDGFRLFNLA